MKTIKREGTFLSVGFDPSELVEDDNLVTFTIQNDSQEDCTDLVVSLVAGKNLMLSEALVFRLASLNPGARASGEITLIALSTGLAILRVRCSSKQGDKTHYDDFDFEFNVKEDSFHTDEPSGKFSYETTYWREYYLNALPKWEKLLLTKTNSLQHLEQQRAMWGELQVPPSIVHQIEALGVEIAKLRQQIEEGHSYLGSTG